MNHNAFILALASIATPLIAADTSPLHQQINSLQQQAIALQQQLATLKKQIATANTSASQEKTKPLPAAKVLSNKEAPKKNAKKTLPFHSSYISIHKPEVEAKDKNKLYPTALVSDDRVLLYIAGTPVVTSPYTGERPAFDGSDHIVNISSINRDIRLMQQRQKLYQTYRSMGYEPPNIPIVALSGKLEPLALYQWPYVGHTQGDLTLGSSELDVAAALNKNVEGFMSIAFDDSPPQFGGQRVNNSSFDLNLGFVNIGNLDRTPFYFTAGQLYAPFGRYSSAMISSPITLRLTRTKTRPFIFGYKSMDDVGPFAAAYAFVSDTTLAHDGVLGVNLGYKIARGKLSGEIGAGFIGSVNDSGGMQRTGSPVGTTFGGFASFTNGSEAVKKIPAAGAEVNLSYGRYNFTAEWVGVTETFRQQDLSFNGQGANPYAAQLETGVTFKAFRKPASVAVGYQWSKDALALNIPQQRIVGVFNISIWKDTVESLEYRHDIDYKANTYANGANSTMQPYFVNANTLGTGQSSDTITAQIGIYF